MSSPEEDPRGRAVAGEASGEDRGRSRLARWLDDRAGAASLARFLRDQSTKLVPARLSWVYTTGTLALFFFGIQFLTGALLVLYYVPDEKLAFGSVQMIEHRVSLGWLVRQMHAWGSNFIVIVLVIHILKVLWYGSYKKPRELTWFAGFILLVLSLGFCLSGYLLPWNQLAFWATRVAVGAVDAVPWLGEGLKGFICGGPDVSGRTLGRFYALHVIFLPALVTAFIGVHLALVLRHGIAPRTTVPEEERLGHDRALEVHGAEPFFPRQVYKELLYLTIGFALLVTVATYFPWELGEPMSLETPEGIKPEWYFLPVYQFLKYFDDGLYSAVPGLESLSRSIGLTPEFLGILCINAVAVILFFLPFIDRRPERRISRRPIFATLAFLLIAAILALGVLGYLSERTVTIAGSSYRFTSKGWPEPAGAPSADPPGDPPGDTPSSGRTPSPGGGGSPPAAPAAGHRPDGLPPGGTCGASACHEEEHEEWRSSIHDQNAVECRGCHGGIDTPPPEVLPEGIDAETYAHLGLKQKKSGKPRPPTRAEIPEFCGKCHQDVLSVFSPLHIEKSPGEHPKKSCINCHSNHKVLATGSWLYEKGYTDPSDPRRKPFAAARDLLEGLAAGITAAESRVAALRARGFPVEPLEKEVADAKRKLSESRHLVHSLDEALIAGKVGAIREDLDLTRRDLDAHLAAGDERWKLVAGVWGGAILLGALILIKLRGLE